MFLNNFFSGLLLAANHRLPFVEELDRQAYLRDYIELTKAGDRVKVIIGEENKQNMIEFFNNIITGVVSKPAVG